MQTPKRQISRGGETAEGGQAPDDAPAVCSSRPRRDGGLSAPWQPMGMAPRERSILLWQADGGLCRARWNDTLDGYVPEWGDGQMAYGIDGEYACVLTIVDAVAWTEMIGGPMTAAVDA
jgi:hypothetical protein